MSKVAPILAPKCGCCKCSCQADSGVNGHGHGGPQVMVAPAVRFAAPQREAVGGSESENENESGESESESDESVALLRVRVRALEKYKRNYELLCAQLGELNAQVGRQLARHESDVQTLQAAIAQQQTRNLELETALATQRQITEQDREYSQRVHKQLATAAELLKATEKRVECREQQLLAELEAARDNLEDAQQQIATLKVDNATLQDRLGEERRAHEKHRDRESKKQDAAKAKLKRQVAEANDKYEELISQLQKHRSSCREAKKLAARLQTEASALRKQLKSAQQDAEHLVSILDSQKTEQEETKQALATARRSNKSLHDKVTELTIEREGLQTELLLLQEQLVQKNGELGTSQSELKCAKAELEQRQIAFDNAAKQFEDMTAEMQKQKQKSRESEQQRLRAEKYRCEVRQMRQLLEVNAQQAASSSKDVVSLKQELEHVQELLRGIGTAESEKKVTSKSRTCQSKEQVSDSELDASTDSWRDLLLQNGKAEESVLKCAIMDQVRTFAA